MGSALPAVSPRSEQGLAPHGLCSMGFRERKGSWGLLETAQSLVEVRLLMVLLFTREATPSGRNRPDAGLFAASLEMQTVGEGAVS